LRVARKGSGKTDTCGSSPLKPGANPIVAWDGVKKDIVSWDGVTRDGVIYDGVMRDDVMRDGET
jgi:hypothetical protein